MKAKSARGFTLIELMVALVVAGILMGVLVGLSGSVQRSFGYSKEVTELQANLRFAMRTLVNDFTRIAFMWSPDPSQDIRHRPYEASITCPEYPTLHEAINYDIATGELHMRGNYLSSRDYLVDMSGDPDFPVACRNGYPYNPTDPPGLKCGGYEGYYAPFADGPDRVENVFCPDQYVRLDATGDGRYCFFKIQSVNPAANVIRFTSAISREKIKGSHRWVTPIALVKYQVLQDAAYLSPYAAGTDARFRWILNRNFEGCRNGINTYTENIEVAEFLLPQAMGGFVLEQIKDEGTNVNMIGDEWAPDIGGITPLESPVDRVRLRALVVTLRGRVENEDPRFEIDGFVNSAPFLDFGVDLDGEPANGLARVRVERTVVDLRNMSI